MGWEDRPYYRDRPQGYPGGVLGWILYGSVPLFTAFGIRVRAQAQLLIWCGLILLFGFGFGQTAADRVQTVTALFAVILLHEFGHCFAARWTGGSADEIMMTPLGGLAMTMARRRPWPTFITIAGGPAVNVVICLLCGLGLFALGGGWPFTPGQFYESYLRLAQDGSRGLMDAAGYFYWIYGISYALLLFNLLPVYPLDGGQMLQSILWKPMGYYRSMILTLNIGLAGSVLMVMVGLATLGTGAGFLLVIIGLNCLMNCVQMRRVMQAEGQWAFTDEDQPDYSGGGYGGGGVATARRERKPKGPGWFARQKAARTARQEADEQGDIDTILAKVSAQGMHSLTWAEKRALKRATENQRRRDQDRAAGRKRSLGA